MECEEFNTEICSMYVAVGFKQKQLNTKGVGQ